MKIVLTGSLGHIGRPLVPMLAEDHEVIVVTSNSERVPEIESLHAVAAVGSVVDTDFLTRTFAGVDAVYTMVPPPGNYFDPGFDASDYNALIRKSYFNALSEGQVKRVVNLSSWGAHRETGTGGIVFSHYMEQQLNQLPADVSITHVRPTSFYYNMLSFIPMIRHRGEIVLNYGGEDVVALVHPRDIAGAIAAELTQQSDQRTVRYVASQELSCIEIAKTLGDAIGNPALQWKRISFDEAKKNLLAAGLPEGMANSVAEIQQAIHNGNLAEDYVLHKPVLGKIKIEEFASEFAMAYNKV